MVPRMNAQQAVTRLRDKGWSDAQIAAELECTAVTIYQWGRGERAAKLSTRMFKLFELAKRR